MAVIEGGQSSGLADVGSLTKAIRFEPRPADVGVLGSYRIAAGSGVMAAGLAGVSPIFSMRWADSTRALLLRRLAMIAKNDGTAFAAGDTLFELMFARGFTASDTGGTSILPTGNSQKKRTSFGTTLITDLRIASTGTLTAGTRTLDTSAHATIKGFVPAGAAVDYPMVGKANTFVSGAATASYSLDWQDLYELEPNHWPLVFVQNEGFIIRATVPATGTWTFDVLMDWDEIATTGGFN